MSTVLARSWCWFSWVGRRVWTMWVVVGVLSLPTFAVADIAPDPLSGGVNFSGTTDKVEMSEESVTLTVSSTKCTTNAVFQMKNLTDTPVTMEVGFPFAYPEDLQDFQAKIDGKAAQDVGDKSVGRRQKWKVWTMTFPASKVTTVEVDYWNKPESRYSWLSAPSSGMEAIPALFLDLTAWQRKPTLMRTEDDQRKYNALAERLQHQYVGYILTTGAGWAGTIGKCRIEAKFDGFTSESLITRFPLANEDYLPRDPRVLEKGLVWELKDFEPKDDIRFSVSPNITRSELKQLIQATLKQHPHHPRLTLVLGDYCETEKDQMQHQEQVDEMLVAWSKTFAIDGPDYVDRNHAMSSFHVWFRLTRWTIDEMSVEPLEAARQRKLLPTIRAIATRLQSQLPPEPQTRTDRLNEYQVKTFREESQRMLDWCHAQK